MDTPEDGRLVMLVGDLPEQMKFTGDPETAHLVSDTYGGAWFGARLDGEPALAFGLVDMTGTDAAPAAWYVTTPPADQVATAAAVPHLVAVVPSDAPGVEALGHDVAGSAALLTEAAIVETAHQLPSLRSLRAVCEGHEAVNDADLVDIKDPDAVKAALAPVRSRVARASGELLGEGQLVPMAWRPWHYDLIQEDRVAGLLWQWPVIQTYFELGDPGAFTLDGIASPTQEQQRKLRGYLGTVERLARSMSINSGGSVSANWNRDGGFGPVEVDAPHDDALAALLSFLRQLFDATEGSGASFNQILGLLSRAANDADLSDLVGELRRWRKAHTRLRRGHVAALRHELAEEASGESLGTPSRGFLHGVPEIASEQLILTFMYGETLHRDDERAAQIEEWDRDPLLGPLMRQEVRADAGGFVHFYGAFGCYVDRWLAQAEA
jgi:hypothetical protein